MRFASSTKENQAIFSLENDLSISDILNDECVFAQMQKAMAKESAEMSVTKSFNQLAANYESKKAVALESLDDGLMQDLADMWGCSTESIMSMKAERFLKKCEDSAKIEASNESFAIAALVVGACYVAAYVMILAYIIKMAKLTNPDIDTLFRSLDKAFGDKINEALDDVVINTFDCKEYEKQIKACQDALSFLKKDMKTIFDPNYKLSEIEKVASKLWGAPDTWSLDENIVWWKGWRTNLPDTKSASLKDHGFNVASLIKVCRDLSDLCRSLMTFGEIHKEKDKAAAEALKKPNIFKRIYAWFTESEDVKNEKAQARVIVAAKHEALWNLCDGLCACVNTMARGMYEATLKCDKLVKKAKPSDK